MGETLTNANPHEITKIKTHHARIVADGTAEKPYYSIELYDHTKNEYFLGYSSYYIDYVLKWLEECFEIVEATKTNADRIRAMSDEELADMLWKTGRNYRAVCADPVVDYNEQHEHIIDWLKQPAE